MNTVYRRQSNHDPMEVLVRWLGKTHLEFRLNQKDLYEELKRCYFDCLIQ